MKNSRLLSLVLTFGILLQPTAWASSDIGDAKAFDKAIQLTNSGDYQGSKIILESLTKAYPKNALYWFNLGNSYFQINQHTAAISAYQNVIVLKSPLVNPAKLYIAMSFKKLKEPKRAEKILISLLNSKLPPNLMKEVKAELSAMETAPLDPQAETDLRSGLKFYEAGDYDAANEYFSRSLQADFNPKALIMRGLAQLKRNHREEAREDFTRVLESKNPLFRLDAQYFLKQIQNENWEKKSPYWLFLDFAGGYNSNVYENGKSETLKSGSIGQFLAGAGYHFFRGQPISTKLGYQFYQEEVFGIPEARFLSHSLQSFLNYDTREWFIQGSLSLQSQDLGSNPLLSKKSAGLKIQKSFDKHDLGAVYRLSDSSSRSPTYEYLAGTSNNLKIYYNYNGTRFFLSLFASYSKNGGGDLVYSSGAVLPLAGNSRSGGISFDYYPNAYWELADTFSYSVNSYDNRALPTGAERSDRRVSNYTKVSYKITASTKIYFSEEMFFNTSTLAQGNVADKNYDKFVTLMGITWDALP